MRLALVPPSGGSLEIGNNRAKRRAEALANQVPPSGGSLEIGNQVVHIACGKRWKVPPSGGSLEIGNVIH